MACIVYNASPCDFLTRQYAELVSGGTTLLTVEQDVEVESVATPTSTPTTNTPTATNTPTPTPTPTATPTPSPGDTPIPTSTPTPTPTATPTSIPSASNCVTALSGYGNVSDSWTSGCQSVNRTERGVHYARYYTFTMSQAGTATINLDSSTDPYLILLSGRGKNGKFVTDNDDINFVTEGSPLNNFNSEISRALEAGDYVIEATTYESQSTGDFTLTVVTPDLLAAQIDAAVAMIGALHGKVLQNTTYTAAQTALANCLSPSDGPTGQSASLPTFDDILGNYNTHKSKMESGGECASQATAMFTALQAASKSELAKLKATNASYAALLNTPHGQAFETNVGNADIIKLYATLASPQMSEDSSASSENGPTGTADTPAPTPVPREGVNCLRAGEPAPTTPAAKLAVLNCLVFDTPHSFWVTQSGKTKTGNDLAGATDDRYDFLGYGDWSCSKAPDVPFLASCLKHDVSYSSLKKFVPGLPLPAMFDFDKDSAWHPRNKYLADLTLEIDLMEDTENWEAPPASCTSLLPDVSMWIGRDADSAYFAYVVCKTYNTQTATFVRAEVMYFVLSALYPPVVWSPSTSDIIDVFWKPWYVIDATQ